MPGYPLRLPFLALVFQFKHAVKPPIVFAAIPYGVVGALAVVRLLIVPVIYATFVLDLELVTWNARDTSAVAS